MATSEYTRKRDFEKTPEPRPGARSAPASSSFVVHRHDARRLHYDLRLSAGGRLLSWAVPKGFSYNPANKRLAVRTEDHPIEYLEFEGIIPKGEYGAGTMDVWDRGEYRLNRAASLEEAEAAGEIKLSLYGKRLRGEWHLVRTREKDWLLFKARDLYAREADSLLPGSIEPARLEAEELPVDLERMVAAGSSRPFSDPSWLFELEFEGWRVFAGKRGGEPMLLCPGAAEADDSWCAAPAAEPGSRTAAPAAEPGSRTATPGGAVRRALAVLVCQDALLDAVLVAVDGTGRPSRAALEAAWKAGGDGVALYLLDILNWEGFSTRALSLRDRKDLLRSILPASTPGSPNLLFVDSVAERGERLAAEAARAGHGALVAKRADSPYIPGASELWVRIPLEASGGWRSPAGEQPGSASWRGEVQLTNPDKVFWPVEGYTKRDLFTYYEAVAELVVPHLKGRPVHMRRFPSGIGGKSFYQRRAPDHTPEWVPTVELGAPPERHILCNDRRTLLYLINLASIDLHPWLSRAESPDSPDWAVVDIDAKESDFPTAVRIARKTGSLLRGLGLRAFVKSSGGSGLHVFVPLASDYSYEQSRMFAEAVARVVVMENGDAATVERNPSRRGGKVYLDFLQNRKGQTIVPPYSVRPVPGARVSMPLDWDELRGDLRPGLFTLKSAPERVRQMGDLFRPVLEGGQDLREAIAALDRHLRHGRSG